MRTLRALVPVLVLCGAAGAVAGEGGGLKYMAMGDSFTAGSGSSTEQSYPARLRELWLSAGMEVELQNVAEEGHTSEDVVKLQLPKVEAFHPDFVTITVGANDIAQGKKDKAYRAALKKIFSALITSGVPSKRIFVLSQPNWSEAPAAAAFGEPEQLAQQIRDYNNALRDECKKARVSFIDLTPLTDRQAKSQLIASDGLHPSALAYEQWARRLQVEKVVMRELAAAKKAAKEEAKEPLPDLQPR
jgi:acyl-CoA thioesterase-1